MFIGQIRGRKRRVNLQPETDRDARGLNPGVLGGQHDDAAPAAVARLPARHDGVPGGDEDGDQDEPGPRAASRPSGTDAVRASLTHEADGNGGLVLRSGTRERCEPTGGDGQRQAAQREPDAPPRRSGLAGATSPPGRYRRGVAVLLGRHEEFAAHDTGSWHPERAERLAAVFAGIEDVARRRLPSRSSLVRRRAPSSRSSTTASYIEQHRGPLPAGEAATSTRTPSPVPASFDAALTGRGGRPRRGRAAAARRGGRGVPRRAPAGSSRARRAGDGVLPVQQRRRDGRAARRPRRAGHDPRLGRPPRQRHPGPLLRATPTCSTSRCTSSPSIPGPAR